MDEGCCLLLFTESLFAAFSVRCDHTQVFFRCDSSNNTTDPDLFWDVDPTMADHSDPYAIDYGLDIYGFLTPFIIVIGLFGNTVSLLIFKRK